MNLLPLYNYFGFINGKYAIALVGLAVFLSFLSEKLGVTRPAFAIHVFANSAFLIVTFFTLGFLSFTMYTVNTGGTFEFLSLSVSFFIVFSIFLVSGIGVQSWNDALGFHILFFILAIFASALLSVLFSGLMKIAEKLSLFDTLF